MIEQWFEPFVQVGYDYDGSLTKFDFRDGAQPRDEKSGYMIGAGAKLYGIDNWSGMLEVTHHFGQGKLRITTATASIRYEF